MDSAGSSSFAVLVPDNKPAHHQEANTLNEQEAQAVRLASIEVPQPANISFRRQSIKDPANQQLQSVRHRRDKLDELDNNVAVL